MNDATNAYVETGALDTLTMWYTLHQESLEGSMAPTEQELLQVITNVKAVATTTTTHAESNKPT